MAAKIARSRLREFWLKIRVSIYAIAFQNLHQFFSANPSIFSYLSQNAFSKFFSLMHGDNSCPAIWVLHNKMAAMCQID